ncbi:MAG: hypothetical protein Q8S84_06030 [bacterium]|nr:hypothetical protein [bacterium]MDP3381037.1 hypothetical protein [bacterium]
MSISLSFNHFNTSTFESELNMKSDIFNARSASFVPCIISTTLYANNFCHSLASGFCS